MFSHKEHKERKGCWGWGCTPRIEPPAALASLVGYPDPVRHMAHLYVNFVTLCG